MGNIELVEIKQKLALRSYNDHKNQINCLDFAANKRSFISCSNDTSWKLYDIQNISGAIMTCQAAHSDNIKQVMFLPKTSDIVISGSSDKYLKIWRIKDDISLVSQLRLNESIEKFVLVDQNLLIVANGNLISLVKIDKDYQLKILQNIHVF